MTARRPFFIPFPDMKNELTPEQTEALDLNDGAVVAGAGAGKTRTMVAKVVHDQANGISPDDQIVVTFTNAAALEMEARLNAAGAKKPRHLGTLHALALRTITRAWGGKLQVVNDRGYDAIIKTALKKVKLGATPTSTAREWIMTPPRAGNGRLFRQAVIGEMKGQRIVHPDVMLSVFRDLTVSHPETSDVRVYVDEAQDASSIDAAIYSNLSKSGKNRGSLILFGDPRQAIYAFRGADPEIFVNAIRAYGEGVVNLTANFRSSWIIVDEANRIGALMGFHESLVAPMKAVCNGYPTDLRRAPRYNATEQEALALVDDIRRALDDRETVAVLARYNAVVDVVAAMLRGEGIAVDIPGREVAKDPALDRLRNLALDDFPPAGHGWERHLMTLGVPFAYQDILAKMLSSVTSPLEIGPIIDEALGKPSDSRKVWVSTIHAAKGLEWDQVHLVGADSLSFDPADQEDIRLAYVAVTRAAKRFTVSFASNRAADRRVDGLQPSPLLFP